MSIQASGWALEQDLPARPKLVLVAIANHADHTNGYCWLRATTIAAEAACTPRSVFRYVGSLVRNGYIRKAPRKGADGKQRANDYWIVLDRPEAEWDWDKSLDNAPDDEDVADDGVTEEAELPKEEEPCETLSHGEGVENSVSPPADKHAVSYGPCDSRVTRVMDEPSKTNPSIEEKCARASVAGPPRTYRPSPQDEPPRQGAVADPTSKQIFVYFGTDAWNAWARHRERTQRNKIGYPTTTRFFENKSQRGWYFPSLYPSTVPEQMAAAPTRESIGPPRNVKQRSGHRNEVDGEAG